jgi:hypothetical protein
MHDFSAPSFLSALFLPQIYYTLPGLLKSIGVSVSDTGVEVPVSEDRVSDTEKSIECPALII